MELFLPFSLSSLCLRVSSRRRVVKLFFSGGVEEAGQASYFLVLVGEARDDLRCGVGALTEPHQGVGEGGIGVHWDVAGDVVEDVGFGQVVEGMEIADGDGGGELAIAEAVEKEK